MQMKRNILRILLFLFVFQGETRAIECYQCNSKEDEDCTDSGVDVKYLKPCPPSHKFCRKAVYIYYFTDPQEHISVCECAQWRNAERDCYKGRYTRDSYQLVCECHGVGCNRSARSSSRTTIFLCVLCQIVLILLLI